MNFYSIPPSEIGDLSVEEVVKMDQAINIIKADDVLTAFQISAFPNFKKEQREKIHQHYHKIANPGIWEREKRPLTLKEIAEAMGNGRR